MIAFVVAKNIPMADLRSPARAGPRRRAGKPTAAARRDRLLGRERQAVNVAKELAQQLERAEPLALCTRCGWTPTSTTCASTSSSTATASAGVGQARAARAMTQGPQQAPQKTRSARGSSVQQLPQPLSRSARRGRRRRPPSGQPQRPQQPSKAPEAPSALQQPAPAATPERPAAVQPGTCVQCVPHAEATAEPAQVGPPFCHIQPSRHGRRPRVPTTEVGRAIHVIREGVRAVAPVVDGGQSYDPARYYKGKIAIDGIASQDVEVPRGSIMHELLAEGPAAAGAEGADLIRRCEAMEADVESEVRKLLLPDEMMAPSDSSCSDSSSPAEPEPFGGFRLFGE